VFRSAEEYVQTVVLVDDHIYEDRRRPTPGQAVTPKLAGRKAATKNLASTPGTDATSVSDEQSAEDSDEASFDVVQNSFAKKRIICSLYQPRVGASFGSQSEVYRLCTTADVVIVDWNLYSDLGVNATKLAGGLTQQSHGEVPQQLRLVLIYTLQPNLGDVASKVYDDLVARLGEDNVEVESETNGLVLTTEFCRVVVLGKKENPNLAEFSDHYVPEKHLADRTILEFSRLSSGLLQGIALRSIAKLRSNNRRILARFSENLDAAFFTHRALVLPEEPFESVPDLLSNELRAVLEDTLADSALGSASEIRQIIEDWCKREWLEPTNPALAIGQGVDAQEFALDVLCNGPELEGDYEGKTGSQISGLVQSNADGTRIWKDDSRKRKLAKYLLKNMGGEDIQERLGALMSQRMMYETSVRKLHLGVIVKELDGKQRYRLCLQPLCDSVRLDSNGDTFLFCALSERKQNENFTHCVIDPTGEVLRLKYKPSTSCICVSSFRNARATQKDNGPFVFSDVDKRQFEWIAELKTEHAQHAAELFGNQISRVALTQSEWVRLKTKQG